MSLVYQNVLSAQDYCSLRAAVCWPALDPAQAQAALAGSSQIAACYDGAHAVGAARVLYDGACLACLTDIMVLPYYQGRGIGKALVAHSLQKAKELGYVGMQFNAVVAGNRSAIAAYEGAGFRRIGCIEDGFRLKSGELSDMYIYFYHF